jgi:hypothetical protein
MVAAERRETGVERTFEDVKAKLLEFDKRMGDKPGTIWATRDDMKRAGFRDVDCLWMYLNLAVLVAVKTPA